jgi:mannose-6-phosphate isomerase-like protein (cupin superfamily)
MNFLVSPGIQVRELVGRTAAHKSSSYSVAHFTVGRGRTSATTYTRMAEETLIVLKGRGWLARGSQSEPIGPGSVLVVSPRVPRSIAADSTEDLEVMVVSSPAFEPRDSVRGSP